MVHAEPGRTTVELVTCAWSYLKTNKKTPANQTKNLNQTQNPQTNKQMSKNIQQKVMSMC